METLKAIKEGDIFYTQFNKKYYFMQIIHITKDLPYPYDVDYKYGYYIVLFEKFYRELPKSIKGIDLINIYKIKYKPKNTILYISHWDTLPEIKLDKTHNDYKKYSKYDIKYFGNSKGSHQFNPKIVENYTLPSRHETNSDGLIISPTIADIGWIFYILEEDEKNKNMKLKKIKPKYFKKWIETVEPEILIKIENIVYKYENANANKNLPAELKKCINSINKVEEKNHSITTIEAEELHEKLLKISKIKGLSEKEAEKIIEDNRDW